MENNTILDYNIPPQENQDPYFYYADKGLRFANYLLDNIFLGFGSFVAGLFLGTMKPEFALSSTGQISSYLLGLLLSLVYYTVMEGYFDGKTIGKMVTNTRAIRNDGQPLTTQDALVRSLCRTIPFPEPA